jgi:hypothetical protein
VFLATTTSDTPAGRAGGESPNESDSGGQALRTAGASRRRGSWTGGSGRGPRGGGASCGDGRGLFVTAGAPSGEGRKEEVEVEGVYGFCIARSCRLPPLAR